MPLYFFSETTLIHYKIRCVMLWHTGSKELPYLKVHNMTSEEKERLIASLKVQSKVMKAKFAALVTKVGISLRNSNSLNVFALASFFTNAGSGYKELAECIKTTTSIFDALDEVGSKNYWTFYNYEILKVIIDEFCKEDKNVTECLTNYLSQYKEYCKRRLAEVPIDDLNVNIPPSPERALYLKLDDYFHFVCLNDIKEIQSLISSLLGFQQLSLVEVEEGCIELTFKIFEEINNLVVYDQEVKWLHCGMQKFEIRSLSFPDEPKGIGEMNN